MRRNNLVRYVAARVAGFEQSSGPGTIRWSTRQMTLTPTTTGTANAVLRDAEIAAGYEDQHEGLPRQVPAGIIAEVI
jgi:hypothetical protein